MPLYISVAIHSETTKNTSSEIPIRLVKNPEMALVLNYSLFLLVFQNFSKLMTILQHVTEKIFFFPSEGF